MAVLQLQQVEKSYGRIKALNGVSFEVPEGSVYGILGPNGSGKTTLLSIILDVLKADKGDYKWFGEPGSPAIRKKIGSLLETPNFYHYLSGANNLRVTQSISERGTKNSIDEVLQKVKLAERKNSRFSSYSLGMKQRLAIGAALLGNPRVLVLDEPTNGLDPVGIAEMRELIKDLHRQGHTIIMASHLLDEVEKVCTHVAILKTGNLITHGAVDEVLVDEDIIEIGAEDDELLTKVLMEFAGYTQMKKDGNYFHLYFEKGTAKPEEINAFCFSKGLTLSHLVFRKQRLEAKFFELTGN
ncbi:MAG TPA: ATP-binding cassette domain-containing protein [Chitinophagaceae bacterium]|nr:ATP-binding cassette domain-containing protein [Chitinophagaceae bacterium]